MRIDLAPDRPRVEIGLSDGSVAAFSPLQKEDRHWLEEGFDELSIPSRYSRFGVGVAHLTSAEFEYLVDVDQTGHVAWGASIDEAGAGIGRYISVEGGCPEMAVTVIDEFQGHGLGKLLVRALVSVARFDGVSELCFELAPDNSLVRLMLSGFARRLDSDGGRIVISDVDPTPEEELFVSVIQQFRM